MEFSFLSATLSFFVLLSICVFTYIFSKKVKLPYTVLLVIMGLFLVPLSNTSFFSFLWHFQLKPDLLFYVFLPILLFESGYNMNYRELLNNWKTIWSLAVFWLIISAIIVSVGMYFMLPLIGVKVPFMICLLFWAFISSTDPVAVLAIFKSLWAPKRLTLLFEWESLFNDWTSLSLFLVILTIILSGWLITPSSIFEGVATFTSMLVGWLIFGSIMGVSFSKILERVKNNELAEITLTMILAHLTFIFSELISHHVEILWFHLRLSSIIATATAWIILWNYWRYKISPKIEVHMSQFWELFAFIANSLVFILMWLVLAHVDVDFASFLVPTLVTIWIIMFARTVSVFIPINLINRFKLEEKIPKTYTTLLSWWSLRGALSMMMVMMIPWPWEAWYESLYAFQQSVGWTYSFSIKDFLMVLTIGCIMFTLFIKATTVPVLMKRLWLTKLSELEEFEYQEWKILATLKMHEKIKALQEKNYLSSSESHQLKDRYEDELKESVKTLEKMIHSMWSKEWKNLVETALSLHSLWIEKQYLKDLFTYNEISEKNYRYILDKINRQIERLESGDAQLRGDTYEKTSKDIFQKIYLMFAWKEKTFIDEYTIYRTKAIITRKVIKELTELSEIDFWFDKDLFENVISVYKNFNDSANKRKDEIHEKYKAEISLVESNLVSKSLLKLEENIIEDLYSKEIITPKLYVKFNEEIEKGILTDIQKIG